MEHWRKMGYRSLASVWLIRLLQISSIIFLPPKSYGTFYIKHCKCWHEKTMTQSCQQESDDVIHAFPARRSQKIWTDFLA